MRYAGPTIERGPLDHVVVHPAADLRPRRRVHGRARIDPGPDTPARVGKALDFLLERRRSSGLVFVVHPWETGADDSPRWDGWMAADWEPLRWDYRRWTDFDLGLVPARASTATARQSARSTFRAAPAAFNALTAHAALELAELTGDGRWRRRAERLAAVIDERLWDEGEGLWSDEAVVGGGGIPSSRRVPTLDEVLPALVTDAGRAGLALDQLMDPARFSAPAAWRHVARDHAKYQPDVLARHGLDADELPGPAGRAALGPRADVAAEIVKMSRRAAGVTGFAEHAWSRRPARATAPRR